VPSSNPQLIRTDGRVTIGGVAWAYAQVGHGPTDLVAVHGWQNDAGAWQPLVDRLPPDRFRTTVVDLPGCGASGPPQGWRRATIDALAVDLGSVVDVLGLRAPSLVGHSLGAAIGLAAALARPELFERLVLVGPASTSGLDFVDDAGFAALCAPSPEQRRALVRAAFHRSPGEDVLARLEQTVAAAHPDHVEGGARSMRAFAVQGELSGLRPRCLVVAGDRDRHVPIDHHLATWAHLDRAGLQVFHDVGHVPFWEVPDACAEVVARFLS
jgi:sigma-B regulation protein RsbQ